LADNFGYRFISFITDKKYGRSPSVEPKNLNINISLSFLKIRRFQFLNKKMVSLNISSFSSIDSRITHDANRDGS